MERYLSFVFQGSRGTVTASGRVCWRNFVGDYRTVPYAIHDIVAATLYRMKM